MQTFALITRHDWATVAINRLTQFGGGFDLVPTNLPALILSGGALLLIAEWRFRPLRLSD